MLEHEKLELILKNNNINCSLGEAETQVLSGEKTARKLIHFNQHCLNDDMEFSSWQATKKTFMGKGLNSDDWIAE